jgi:hypothetical protein
MQACIKMQARRGLDYPSVRIKAVSICRYRWLGGKYLWEQVTVTGV